MAKVRDIFPETPKIRLNTEAMKNVTLSDIWANYDSDTDSLVIYVTGKPAPGVNVYLQDDVYAIADTRDNNKVIGLYFESWENYVPKFPIVNRSWSELRGAAISGKDITLAIRVLALELVMSVGTKDFPALEMA
jgi:hypothetical protein